jgi:anthranilate synthase/aminodeoxychorismate synthase-like glutamine amidotransferase
MILLIDNYDSFVYNLAQFLGELGAEIEVRRNNKTSIEEIERLSPTTIIISPGPGTPKDSGISPEILLRFKGKIPIMGVCLGHQTLGEVFGGRVLRADKIHPPFTTTEKLYSRTLKVLLLQHVTIH